MEKNLYTCRESNPRPPGYSLFTVLSKISRLSDISDQGSVQAHALNTNSSPPLFNFSTRDTKTETYWIGNVIQFMRFKGLTVSTVLGCDAL